MLTVKIAHQGAVAVATIDNPPVNALGAALRRDLAAAVTEVMADPEVEALVIAAAGKAFIAGADISEFGKPLAQPILPEVIALIEDARKPVVAAIQGVALGGGLEVVLACHGRVALPAAKLGLPEIKLGIIPGAGGTQRLPRLIGAAKAFPMMLSGEPVAAQKALDLGLVDRVVEGDLVAAAVGLAQDLAAKGRPRKTGEIADKLTPADREAFEALARDATAKSGDMPNAMALIEAVRGAFTLPLAEGLANERALFARLVVDERSKALRHAFFAEREAAKVPGIDDSVKPRPIARAAVIGAGTMGGGIAMCFANAGIPVTLIETSQEQVEKGHARIRDTYGFSVKRGSMTEATREQRMALITPAVGIAAAAEADIVIEAAFEEMSVKREIFGALDKVAKPGAVLASNTSYLDLTEIAAATTRPADVLGMHFFSPANVMKLLEIVRPEGVAADVVATAIALGRRLGKVPVVVGNCFGFVGNRMLEQRTRAAERLLVTGALPHEVDAALTGFGFKMGPFAMSDLAGNDIGWRSRKSRGKTAAVADAICERGWFGQKIGRGYYLYPEGARAGQRDPEVEALIADISAKEGVARRGFTSEEILARLLDPMVNEGARILEEGIATRSGDIDIVWLTGYNWPAWRGGPMHWAEAVGLDVIVRRLEEQAAESGDASLEPAPLLRRLAAEGRGFSALKAA
ncbi:MAG: enoyl-CoA hydratase/isomerase family protein [Bosea sp.]|uniref:3-hydroxyacyl-CoA dehydrogenase NAD-binding domain-containing protein n=1 Tax=Bosea sp. (in: a-proteobacteria) TaxID=1871050 RepID=UPI001AC1C80E|nr:3-hydroxyacyl-CoA dehydrogenase NAD-binding domain-containing protein [Bosea sp. (in: a-proteobacteria)]MBN9468334.1 enoyl-CoA hydratase/isomerase family protein [Bosea sp. (in: a-proteobacteria)]